MNPGGPWFDEAGVAEKLSSAPAPTAWPKGKPYIGLADFRETERLLLARNRHLILLVAGVISVIALLSWLTGLMASAKTAGMVVGTVASLGGYGFLYSLAAPARRAMLGATVSVAEACREAGRVFVPVLVVTTITSVLLGIALAMCVVPAVFLLPYIVRAPYEAALGHHPLEALARAFRSTRVQNASSVAAGSLITLSGLTFIVLGILKLRLAEVTPLPEWAGSLLQQFSSIPVSMGLWLGCLACFITGDAALAGLITPDTLAAHRLASKPLPERLFVGVPGRLTREAIFLAACATFVLQIRHTMSGNITSTLPAVGVAAPAFELASLDGQSHALVEYAGKPTALYFWAPWCAPCSGQVKALHELMDDGAEVNIVSVALSYAKREEVEQYVKDKSVRYPVLLGDDAFLEKYPVKGFPTVMLLDKNGVVSERWGGVTSAGTLKDSLAKLAATTSERGPSERARPERE